MKLLKQSTAGQVVTLPPLLDATDGDTKETLLTPAATDVKLSKAGGAYAAKNDATAPTVDPTTAGVRVTLDATDTATLGELVVHMHITGALYVEARYTVVPAGVYDVLVSNVEGTLDLKEILRILLAYIAGPTTISGNLVKFLSQDGNTERIVGTMQSDGERTTSVDGS